MFSCTGHPLHHRLAAVPLGRLPHRLLHPAAERTVGIWGERGERERERERGGGDKGTRGEERGKRVAARKHKNEEGFSILDIINRNVRPNMQSFQICNLKCKPA